MTLMYSNYQYYNCAWAIDEVISKIPGYDPTYELVYFNSWSDYEESGHWAVFVKDDEYFTLTNCTSVYETGPHIDEWVLMPVTLEKALEFIDECEEALNALDRR